MDNNKLTLEDKLINLMTMKKYTLVELTTDIAESPREKELQPGEKQSFCTIDSCNAFTLAGAYAHFINTILDCTSDYMGYNGGEIKTSGLIDVNGFDNMQQVVATTELKDSTVVVEFFIIEGTEYMTEKLNRITLKKSNFTEKELAELDDNYIDLID